MNEVETALYGALTSESSVTDLLAGTASVYNQQAPDDAAYPLIIFNQQSGRDENTDPTRSRDLLYMVKGVSMTNLKAAGSIDAAVDALLHDSTLSVSGWTTFWLTRETDINFTETTAEGATYYHRGGVYRLRITK